MLQILTSEITMASKEVVSEKNMVLISARIREWENLAPYLDIDEADIVVIKKDYKDFYEQQKTSFLRKWKQRYGDRATYDCLMEAAKKVTSEQHLPPYIVELLGITCTSNGHYSKVITN